MSDKYQLSSVVSRAVADGPGISCSLSDKDPPPIGASLFGGFIINPVKRLEAISP